MKAVVYQRYGPPEVLEVQGVRKPSPKRNEVLIRTHATSVTAGDWRLRKADPFLARLFNGLFKPRRVNILGFELSGVIEEVGADVNTFKPGDAVFAFCGLHFGGYAQYCCLKESDIIAIKPDRHTFTEAATVPLGSLTAWYFLKKASLMPGNKILIYGASGSVGTYAVQLAKHLRANVTGACSSQNVAMVRALGADHTIDYTATDMARWEERFDVVFDAVGKIKGSAGKRLLKSGGRFVSTRGRTSFAVQDLHRIRGLVDEGKLTPVIDRVYTLDTIREAHAYVEQFRKKGNVAVQVIVDKNQNPI